MDLIFKSIFTTIFGISLLSLTVVEACPTGCQCGAASSDAGRMVNCSGRGLTGIPAGLPAETTELRLTDTGLEQLQTGGLSTLTNLKKLHILDNVKLANIQTNAFQGLTSLEELVVRGSPLLGVLKVGLFMGLQNLYLLRLSNNGWTEVMDSMFFGLDKLQILDLSHNKIKTLHGERFSSLLHQVTELDLSYNKLSSLSQKVFTDWNLLATLNIKGNLFNVPPSLELENAGALKYLDISENPIPYLGPFAFKKLKALESLKINDMASLSSVSSSAFAALYNLREFEFRNNLLTQSFTIKHLPSHNKALEYINLSNNTYQSLERALFMERPNLARLALENVPFHCDCKMSWLGEALNDTTRWPWAQAWKRHNESNASTSIQRPPKCASPENLLDFDLVALQEEDYTCNKTGFFNASTDNDTFVNINDSVSFQVVLHPGLPSSLWFHPRGWFIKGVRVENATYQDSNITATEYIDEDRRVVASLSLNSVSMSDLGIYTLVATNAAGNSTYQFRLRPDENGTWPTAAPVIVNSAPSQTLSYILGIFTLLFFSSSALTRGQI